MSRQNVTSFAFHFKIESYWTYEVCHGKHIRQYHEEKETGQVSFLPSGAPSLPLTAGSMQSSFEEVWKMITFLSFFCL